MNFLIRSRFTRALILLAALACHSLPATPQHISTEQSLRAAMVFNFLKFTEFPPDAIAHAEPIRLCIAVGDPRQAEALAGLSGRRVWNRELVVAQFAGRDDNCQVLYVDSRQRWNAAREQHTFPRTLTISAYAGFAQDGGMIEIALLEEGARFDIKLAEGRRAGLRFSPQLLRLARHVYE